MIKEIFNLANEPHVNSGKFPISSINKCWRRKYLELKGLYKEKFSEETLRLFEIGNLIHRQITKELINKERDSFHLVASEVDVPPNRYISGRMDNIISINNENIIIDVKTAGDWTLNNVRDGECKENYKNQVLLYMHLSNIHRGILLFVGKNKGEIEEIEVIYNEKKAKKLVQDIEDFFHNYVEKNIEPPPCLDGDSDFGCSCCGTKGAIQKN